MLSSSKEEEEEEVAYGFAWFSLFYF